MARNFEKCLLFLKGIFRSIKIVFVHVCCVVVLNWILICFIPGKPPSSGNPLPCVFCHWYLCRDIDLERHLRWHIQEKPFSCKICANEFAKEGVKDEHEKTHKKKPSSSQAIKKPVVGRSELATLKTCGWEQ